MTHVLGDRRDYFESIHDVWELFRVIVEQRKQRELNPTLSMLRRCAADVAQDDETNPVTAQRITAMLDFVETSSRFYDQLADVPSPALKKIMQLGKGITRLVSTPAEQRTS